MITKDISILMVEDDLNLGYLLKENFNSKGFKIHLCRDGEEGMKAFEKKRFDLVLLDIMMPKKDGFSVAKHIRKSNKEVPIIFLTAKTFEEDKIEGFELGCDDYVTKPFSARELHLRIMAVLKRTMINNLQHTHELKKPVNLGKYVFDYENRVLTLDGEAKKLSAKEADMLEVLSDNINLLLNRGHILTKVWGNDDYFAAKSMDVYLTRIRKLLKGDPDIEIQNVHGTGFKLMIRTA